MLYLLTMNMPSVNGRHLHQIIAEHPAQTFEELAALMNRADFLVFRELYSVRGQLQDRGELIVQTALIGKLI